MALTGSGLAHYAVHRVGAGGQRRFAAASPRLDYDADAGVLQIAISEPVESVDCVLDEEEVFVFCELLSRKVVGFVVPHYDSYWKPRMHELVTHLGKYVPAERGRLAGALYQRDRATPSVYLPH